MENLIANLIAIVGRENVLSEPDELLVYECDGLPQHKHRPQAVVFPSSTEETAAVLRTLAEAGVPFTPRGAGTGLSGGALALNEGVVIEFARMRKILRIDPANRLAVVQPGVVNLQVSRAAAPFGLYYVPDPSSQPTCTIGGNIAESAGGIHCLKYGTTTDHVLGCRVVLAGGEVVDLDGTGSKAPGYDLLGTFIGSEGTLGIATEATLRLAQIPPAVRTLLAEFAEVNDASHAVSAIIAAGVMPAALEMMDHEIIQAVEASVFAAGLPPDAGAALLIELDGIEAGIDDEAERVTTICLKHGAGNCRLARDEAERKRLWAARKGAFGAIGRISPDSMIQDAVVPRSRLPEVLTAAYRIASKYELKLANVFHAGDGNLHPLICFDSRFPEQVIRVKEAGRELMEVCVATGGTITGEHGVGLDKRELLPLVFSETDMDAMLRVRAAFDPTGLLNPGKIIPLLRGCGEGRAVFVASEDASLLEPATSTGRSIPAHEASKGATSSFGGNTPGTNSSSSRRDLNSEGAAQLIAAIVGDTYVSQSSNSRSLIVSPASTAEVCEIMRLSSSEGWTAIAAGGMTWLNEPTANLIVATNRLNKIIEHEPPDLIAVTEVGVTLREFNDALMGQGQWLPLDPPDDGRVTIGGVVATGLGGAQQYGYGCPRGSVIGMKVVLANGDIVKAGGRVVKNVAGYDLCKLFTGSYGSLGVITEVNFKLRPKPQRESTVVATGRYPDLIANASELIEARLFPVAVELVSSDLAIRLGITKDSDSSVLLARFAGNQKGVEYQTQSALAMLSGKESILEAEVVVDDEALWRSIASVPLQWIPGWRARVLPSDLSSFVETVGRIYGASFDSMLWQAGVGCGRIRMMTDSQSGLETANGLYEALRLAARAAGGTLIIESTMPELHNSEGSEKSARELGRRIKRKLDPQHVFPNPVF